MAERIIYFAGGCFWGVEHFFQGVDGVLETTPGYANGNIGRAPSYEEVYTDRTGFAETVRIKYNPARIGLPDLVDLYFTIIDPLSQNKQGPDEGTRYRTGIYYTNQEDADAISPRYNLESTRLGAPLKVELMPLRDFYPAEERHSHYLDKNPGGYCHIPLLTFRYLRLYQDIKNLLGDETDLVARMAEAASMIGKRMKFFWTGFYRVDGDTLVLGPFSGDEACLRIGYGRGVCGTAWKERRTVIVPDVERFTGHIACSSLSRSEIVVPVFNAGHDVVAVLDIDSTETDTFSPVDALWLDRIARTVYGVTGDIAF
jgi:peptide methionine sulfoxide reductase msrA/msrB